MVECKLHRPGCGHVVLLSGLRAKSLQQQAKEVLKQPCFHCYTLRQGDSE